MKALWHHKLFVIIETHDQTLELQPVDGEEHERSFVNYADPTLIVDPTDGDLDEAEALRNSRSHCCDCPHITYMTTNVETHEHVCQSCGQTFIDPWRVKIYILTKRTH